MRSRGYQLTTLKYLKDNTESIKERLLYSSEAIFAYATEKNDAVSQKPYDPGALMAEYFHTEIS
ncbi:uncharacterized protein ARB_03439 [Trichophyton benhamiae CBS 112371]|uniref:Uncharacterized protein n=1 Tax=Arthroderma benhamiae (strain ATCC MYA-4681 / CBS 112371) TaxID=663331 RepID=D4B4P9_ARTBC|nr:uncharacterized protein ARB_03439 [Trichophyton benhamiae CBS 112371]EFE30097.1 hypothetical protein ARB_03439 [Trichophyton benhamiae CBS 112371]